MTFFITTEGGRTVGSVADIAPQQSHALDSESPSLVSEQSDMSDQHLSLEVLDDAIRRAKVHADYRDACGDRTEFIHARRIWRQLSAMKAIQGAEQ